VTTIPSVRPTRRPSELALARLATYAEGYNIPVFITQNERNESTEPVATVADDHLECEQTRIGPRVVGDDFETLVYPVDDGACYQKPFEYAREHGVNHQNPLLPALLSIDLEQEGRLDDHEERLEELEAAVEKGEEK